MKTLRFIWLLLLSGAACSQSVTISNSSGSTWSVATLSSTITSAGKNYEHVETSAASHSLFKVNALLGWTISVQQTATATWDPSLKLFVRRTGDGTGGAIINGGTTYIQVSSTTQSFFGGLLGLSFARDNVPVQYKIEGLSVTLPVKTYSTTILYTVSGL
ncbi:hypothetical protein [Dyadobacter sandarakinus]|uniref:Uncharacterized protein n=1 Tax=Dyadobacter sandarakinus TaxID=2747268 RepID=A0ABX7I3P7_9BACT|nr:hypothetical protein [Dyadobacter sandarakinus]QRQ99867.1 hypothetical protein HWI92_02505 [Dyadobacter sandarakinus]